MVLLYSVNECPNSLSELSHSMHHADVLFLVTEYLTIHNSVHHEICTQTVFCHLNWHLYPQNCVHQFLTYE